MDIRNALRKNIAIVLGIIALLISVQLFVSCGQNYEKPTTTDTGSALISAATLSTWIDAGLVNGSGFDRVVILDITSYTTYSNGHIPGALFVDSNEMGQNRTDGVAVSSTEILEGSKMDELVQRCGIDGNTTIVFTGSINDAARAYFTFRYWGFPKSRLKLLDGLNTLWSSEYGLETGGQPPVERSTFSVKNNGILRNDLRVSLAEMINYADGNDPDAVPIDIRSIPTATDTSYGGARGKTPGIFPPKSDNVVFEGRIRGAQALLGTSLFDAATYQFNPIDQLINSFAAIGVDSTKKAYVYCVVGKQSASMFFVLDGILGWPAAIYDGSWSQWGQLSGDSSKKGKLDAASPWRTDIYGRSEMVVYNFDPTISEVTFSGTGTNDLVVGSIYTSTTNSTFKVEIQTPGTPDTFRWTGNGGTSWTSDVQITGMAQSLVSGLTVSFGSTSGHVAGESWTFSVTARKNIEQLTADPNVCSATYQANGTTVNNSFGVSGNTSTTECIISLPNSFDTNANRIEEADKAYMGSGGAGNSGGTSSVPSGC